MLESFESLNWLTDQQWQLSNGTPVSSNDVQQEGVKSFIVDSSYPLIYRDFSSGFEMLIGYFYDDASETGSTTKPFLLARKTSGNEWGLGVDNSVSTTHYSKTDNGVTTATAVARTTAWHRFSFERVGSDYILKIDGTDVSVATGTGTASFDRVRVGTITASGTAFGYFDYIQLGKTPIVTFKGLEAGQKLSFYQEDDTQVGTTQTVVTDNVTFNIATIDQPFNGYIKLTRTDGFNPLYRSGLFEAFGGDVKIFHTVDFGRRVTMLDDKPTAMKDDKEANSGKNEGIFFHSRDRVTLVLLDLTNEQRQDLLAWWALAQTSDVYSVVTDSNNTYDGRLAADVEAYSSSFTVDSADGLQAGVKLQLKQPDNRRMEYVTVTDVSGVTITISEKLLHSYEAGDVVRSDFYWPFAISLDRDLRLTLANEKKNRWSLMHSFKEGL